MDKLTSIVTGADCQDRTACAFIGPDGPKAAAMRLKDYEDALKEVFGEKESKSD